jgi:hypothetical protein
MFCTKLDAEKNILDGLHGVRAAGRCRTSILVGLRRYHSDVMIFNSSVDHRESQPCAISLVRVEPAKDVG